MKNALALLALLVSFSTHAAITIGTYNIRNFDYDDRYRIHTNKVALEQILKNLNADVLSVQEINNTPEFINFIATKMPGYGVAISQCGGAHGQHLGFIFNTAKVDLLSFNEDLSISDPGRGAHCNSGSRPMAFGLFQIKATQQRFFGISVHLKSSSRPESIAKRGKQFQIIKRNILELRSKTGVVDYFFAGDMNTTDYTNRGGDYQNLTRVVSELGMVDLAANLKCTAYWWGNTDDGIDDPSLLDHVVVTPGLLRTRNAAVVSGHCQQVSCRQATIRELGVSYGSVSDHCPITAVIQ